MSSVLDAHRLGISRQARRTHHLLRFEGLHYASNDVVPYHIAELHFRNTRQTAAEYVARYMTERHGGEREDWPQLARQFVPDQPLV